MNPSVVDQVSLGSEGFSTLGAGEGSLSSVFAHVHYKYKKYEAFVNNRGQGRWHGTGTGTLVVQHWLILKSSHLEDRTL